MARTQLSQKLDEDVELLQRSAPAGLCLGPCGEEGWEE